MALSRCCTSFVGPTTAVKWVCIPATTAGDDGRTATATATAAAPAQAWGEAKASTTTEVEVAVSGAGLLSLLEVDHPVARGFRDAVLGHDSAAGVGATSAAVLAGAWVSALSDVLYNNGTAGSAHGRGGSARAEPSLGAQLPAVLRLLEETIEECGALAKRNALSPSTAATLLMREGGTAAAVTAAAAAAAAGNHAGEEDDDTAWVFGSAAAAPLSAAPETAAGSTDSAGLGFCRHIRLARAVCYDEDTAVLVGAVLDEINPPPVPPPLLQQCAGGGVGHSPSAHAAGGDGSTRGGGDRDPEAVMEAICLTRVLGPGAATSAVIPNAAVLSCSAPETLRGIAAQAQAQTRRGGGLNRGGGGGAGPDHATNNPRHRVCIVAGDAAPTFAHIGAPEHAAVETETSAAAFAATARSAVDAAEDCNRAWCDEALAALQRAGATALAVNGTILPLLSTACRAAGVVVLDRLLHTEMAALRAVTGGHAISYVADVAPQHLGGAVEFGMLESTRAGSAASESYIVAQRSFADGDHGDGQSSGTPAMAATPTATAATATAVPIAVVLTAVAPQLLKTAEHRFWKGQRVRNQGNPFQPESARGHGGAPSLRALSTPQPAALCCC